MPGPTTQLTIAKPAKVRVRRAPLPRSDRDVKFLAIVYDRISVIVENHVAPVVRATPQGRAWLRIMYAELHHSVPFTMLREPALATPFGVACEAPYVVPTPDKGVQHALHRIRALLDHVLTYFHRLPDWARANLIATKPVQLAHHRIDNIRHLCAALAP